MFLNYLQNAQQHDMGRREATVFHHIGGIAADDADGANVVSQLQVVLYQALKVLESNTFEPGYGDLCSAALHLIRVFANSVEPWLLELECVSADIAKDRDTPCHVIS